MAQPRRPAPKRWLQVIQMDISVFDAGPHDLGGPLPYGMAQFAYLSRSARPEAVRVRAFVESLFRRFPAEHRGNLRSRLRSADDITHQSASFELVLHELMIR